MPKGCSKKPKGKDSACFKHGYAIRNSKNTREPIYLCWVNMRQRCSNPDRWDYKFYGGRGIKICDKWGNYANFLKDMGEEYYHHKKNFPNTSLDRIDVNKGYSKENCKWSTRFEQSNNRNYNVLVTYCGKSQTCGKWVDELGLDINRQELYKRIFTRGWDIERAMTQPYGERFIPPGRWAISGAKGCKKCGTNKVSHGGLGFCHNCYAVFRRNRIKNSG